MKNEMKLNNKGFSLVELIVVIAIMAILVGVLAPSVLGQIDKAKQSKDKQAIDAVATAVAIAWADQDIKDSKLSAFDFSVVKTAAAQQASVADADPSLTSYFPVIYNTVGFKAILLESDLFKDVTKLDVKINTTTGKVTVTTAKSSGVCTSTDKEYYAITK